MRGARFNGKFRFYFFSSLLLAGFVLIGVRLFFLQVVHSSPLKDQAEKQQKKTVKIQGGRGSIFDQKGRPLAVNVDLPSIFSTPSRGRNPSAIAKTLGPILGQDPKTLKRRLIRSEGFMWIDRKVDPSVADRIRKLRLEGVGFLQEGQRFYPKRTLMGHLLGFAGLDNEGLEGIELTYDRFLKGEQGLLVLERDALGGSVYPKNLVYPPPPRGKDLVLTLDEVVQFISEKELDRSLAETSAKGGWVIVMNPHTGEIIALVVRPDFNPNRLENHQPGDWRNRAVTDLFEPGSTFKMITAAAALEEKVVEPAEYIDCGNGSYRFAGGVLHDHEPHDRLTFLEVIQKSSNIGTAKVAERLGEKKLYHYIKAFGFGEKTGVDLNGESAGKVLPPDRWSGRSLASISIGQEIGVTAVQMATAVSAIANGGWLPQPHLVSEIKDARGQVIESFSPSEKRRRILSEKTAHQLTRMLTAVVQKGGTGELAALEEYSVAGKTGTAQKYDPSTGRYSRKKVVSSFVGYVPAEDPRLLIYVVVDEPEGLAWGGRVAAPVFKRIAEQSLSYYGVLPQKRDRVLLVTNR